jgi:hypothetical protein
MFLLKLILEYAILLLTLPTATNNNKKFKLIFFFFSGMIQIWKTCNGDKINLSKTSGEKGPDSILAYPAKFDRLASTNDHFSLEFFNFLKVFKIGAVPLILYNIWPNAGMILYCCDLRL